MACIKCGKFTDGKNICPNCGENQEPKYKVLNDNIYNQDKENENIPLEEKEKHTKKDNILIEKSKDLLIWIFVIVIGILSLIFLSLLFPVLLACWLIYYFIEQYIKSEKTEKDKIKLMVSIAICILGVVFLYYLMSIGAFTSRE